MHCFLNIPSGFDERLFAIHHARLGHLAQFFYHLGRYFSHK